MKNKNYLFSILGLFALGLISWQIVHARQNYYVAYPVVVDPINSSIDESHPCWGEIAGQISFTWSYIYDDGQVVINKNGTGFVGGSIQLAGNQSHMQNFTINGLDMTYNSSNNSWVLVQTNPPMQTICCNCECYEIVPVVVDGQVKMQIIWDHSIESPFPGNPCYHEYD